MANGSMLVKAGAPGVGIAIAGASVGAVSAATVITLPVLILSLFIQKHIVRGLTLGALKG